MSAEELSYEDQRYDMLVKLLNRSYSEELALTEYHGQEDGRCHGAAALSL